MVEFTIPIESLGYIPEHKMFFLDFTLNRDWAYADTLYIKGKTRTVEFRRDNRAIDGTELIARNLSLLKSQLFGATGIRSVLTYVWKSVEEPKPFYILFYTKP